MPAQRWAGPADADVTVQDELDFDALPEETRLLVERVVKHRMAEEGEVTADDRVEELQDEKSELDDENDRLRAVLQDIVDGNVHLEDVVVFAKGALAA